MTGFLLSEGGTIGHSRGGYTDSFANFEPIPVGATVRIKAKAIDKYVKRERRYVRHEVTVEDVAKGTLYLRETRDILSR